MNISVKDLPPQGRVIEDRIPPAALGFEPDLNFREPVDVLVELDKSGRQVTARGRLRTVLTLECHRCCEPFDHPVACAFESYFLPRPERELLPELHEPSEVELGLSYYDDERIDLGPAIHDAVLLELPLKQLCRPDCAGLCPDCGKRRGECGCAREEERPSGPFAEFFREQGML